MNRFDKFHMSPFALSTAAALLVSATVTAAPMWLQEHPESPPPESPAAEKPADLPKATEILDRSLEAMGGKEVFDAIKSWHVEINIDSPGGEMQITTHAAKPDRVLITQSMPGMGEIKRGLNGKVAWMHSPMAGYQLLPAEQAEAMNRQAGMHNIVGSFTDQFETIETVDRVDQDGKDCYKLRLVDADGDESFAFFDADSRLLVAMDVTESTPMGKQTASMTFLDWEEKDKVTLYRTIVIDQMGMQMSMKVTKLEFNAVDESVFELPDEVKGMTEREGDGDGDDQSPPRPTPPPTPQN